MDKETTREEELTIIIDELPIDQLRTDFTSLMQASVDDDPNTQEVAA